MRETKSTIMEESLKAFKRHAKYLSELEPGSEEYEKAFKILNSMGDLAINAAKNEAEIIKQRDDIDRAWTELENKQAAEKVQLKEKRFDNFVRYFLEGLGIGAPLVCYGIWYNRGLKFEETGTVTSNFFRGLINRFRPTK